MSQSHKQEILESVNSAITAENGLVVQMDSKFRDCKLDSISTLLCLLEIDSKYPFLSTDTKDGFDEADVDTLTVRHLVSMCRASCEQ